MYWLLANPDILILVDPILFDYSFLGTKICCKYLYAPINFIIDV